MTTRPRRFWTLAGILWATGCFLRAARLVPGSWWLWTAPYWLIVGGLIVLALGLWIVTGFLRLVCAYHQWRARREVHRACRAVMRSLEADFLRGSDLSGRSENSRPPQPDRSS